MGKNTSISFGNHFEEFINDEIKSGKYGTISEVVRAGLRLLENEKAKIKALQKALEIGENSGFVTNFDFDTHLKDLKTNYRKNNG